MFLTKPRSLPTTPGLGAVVGVDRADGTIWIWDLAPVEGDVVASHVQVSRHDEDPKVKVQHGLQLLVIPRGEVCWNVELDGASRVTRSCGQSRACCGGTNQYITTARESIRHEVVNNAGP